MKTIQFNTRRHYTSEGQIITATLYPDYYGEGTGKVTFVDHSRMIDGEFTCYFQEDFSPSQVLDMYDSHAYRSTTDSSKDSRGCNKRQEG